LGLLKFFGFDKQKGLTRKPKSVHVNTPNNRKFLMPVKFIPEGYQTVTPYLTVQGAQKLLTFLKQVFNAKERLIMPGPDGAIMHGEVVIGDSVIMFSDPAGQFVPRNSALYLYVEDVDATYKRALEAGGKSIKEPADQFYGDRSAGVEDSFGLYWGIATHIEDVSPEEVEKRAKAFGEKQAANS
jgi:PhnB protein